MIPRHERTATAAITASVAFDLKHQWPNILRRKVLVKDSFSAGLDNKVSYIAIAAAVAFADPSTVTKSYEDTIRKIYIRILDSGHSVADTGSHQKSSAIYPGQG